MENDDNKVNGVEMALWLLLVTIPVDAISALVDATGVGAAIVPFFQSGAMFVVRAWFYFSKQDQNAMRADGKQLTRYLSNVLPFVPTVTIVFLIDVAMHNNPERFRAVEGTTALASGKISAAQAKTESRVAALRDVRNRYRGEAATDADETDDDAYPYGQAA